MLLKLTADRHEAHAASLRQLSFLFVQWCVCWTAKYPNRTRTLWSGSCQVRNLWINLDTCQKYLKQEPKKLYTPHHMTTLIGDHWHRSQKFNWYLWARSVYKTDPSNWSSQQVKRLYGLPDHTISYLPWTQYEIWTEFSSEMAGYHNSQFAHRAI